MNPYEPAAELDDAIAIEQPRKTTKAFRRTMWGLVVVAAAYIGAVVAADWMRRTFALYDYWHESAIGAWLHKLIAF